MRTKQYLTLATILLCSTSCGWAKYAELENRVNRLEQILEKQISLGLLKQINEMQDEIHKMRGELEVLQHALKDPKNNNHTVTESANNKAPTKSDPVPGLKTEAKFREVVTTDPVVSSNISAQQSQATQSHKEGEADLYEKAYALVKLKKFAEAETAFKEFLTQYPQGLYTANAHYWLGEVYMHTWQENKNNTLELEKALQEFNVVSEKYKQHHKAQDAILKLGLIAMEREHWQLAKQHFEALKSRYPNTSKAQLAEAKLQKLAQEGKI